MIIPAEYVYCILWVPQRRFKGTDEVPSSSYTRTRETNKT